MGAVHSHGTGVVPAMAGVERHENDAELAGVAGGGARLRGGDRGSGSHRGGGGDSGGDGGGQAVLDRSLLNGGAGLVERGDRELLALVGGIGGDAHREGAVRGVAVTKVNEVEVPSARVTATCETT